MPAPPDLLAPGQTAPDWTLPGVDGRSVHLREVLSEQPATVVMFLCNHCPYVRAYIPRLIALQNELAGRAQFLGVASNDEVAYPEDGFAAMQTHAQKWGLNFPYLRDADQAVARAYGAQRTPEVFVLDRRGVCRYEGGIDNCWQDPAQVTDRPLRDALLALAEARAVDRPHALAVGCTIKWKRP